MKRILLLVALVTACMSSFANSFTTLWTGAGITKNNNYGAGMQYGLGYYKAVRYGIGVGAQLFYQKYDLYYDDQAYKSVGGTMRYTGNYVYLAPQFVTHVVHSGSTQAYVNLGIGYNVGGYDSMYKWSHTSWEDPTLNYDSLIDNSKYMQKMVVRIGFGFIHYYNISGRILLTITEDIGFLPKRMSSVTAPGNNGELANAMNSYYKPLYYTLKLGLTYRTPTDGGGRKRLKIR